MATCCDFMSAVLLYIPDSSDPPSTLQESPTRFPPTRPKTKAKEPSETEKDIESENGMKTKSYLVNVCHQCFNTCDFKIFAIALRFV